MAIDDDDETNKGENILVMPRKEGTLNRKINLWMGTAIKAYLLYLS
jgi:hypothetical protein